QQERERLRGAADQVPAPGVLVDQRGRWAGGGVGRGRGRGERRGEAILRPRLAVGDAVEETGQGLAAVEREGDGRRGALARALPARREQRQRGDEAAAPPGLPGRVRAAAIAHREEAGLLHPARDGALLVPRERRRERQLVDQRGSSRHVLAQREQPLVQRGNVAALEDVNARHELRARVRARKL